MKKFLKDPEIKEKKPDLVLKPNHYHFISTKRRYWNSDIDGTAVCDGNGWYRRKQ